MSDTGSDGQCADGTALAGADGVLVSDDGADVYVTSADSGSVTGYRRDATTGALTPHGCLLADAPQGGPCTSVPALESASGGAISADGRNLYVADGRRPARHAGPRSGHRHPRGGGLPAVRPADPRRVRRPRRVLRGRRDRVCSPGCSGARALDDASAVTVAADGRAVFVGGGYSLSAFARDPATGALTQFGCVESDPTYKACAPGRGIESANGVAASADGRSLYVTSSLSSSVSVFTASVAIVSRSRAGEPCAGDPRGAGLPASGRTGVCRRPARAGRGQHALPDASGRPRTVSVRLPRRARRVAVIVARAPHTGDVRRTIALRKR